MADFEKCIDWVLRFEDSTLSGKVVVLKDGAGRTRFGITEKNHPTLPPDFFTTDAATALEMAKATYRAEEWHQICGDILASDEVAATLLSFAINDGERFEAKVFQRILGATPDGVIGSQTVGKANLQDGPTLAAQLRVAQADHYRALAASRPEEQQYLNGWLHRAAVVYPARP